MTRLEAAAQLLENTLPVDAAIALVLLGAVADIVIGVALLIRPLMRIACTASILLTLAYCAGAAVFAPHLWADPLGPMVKTVPALGLALAVMAAGESR